MNLSLATRHSSLAAALALAIFSAGVAAQSSDPMRPPSGFGVGEADVETADAGQADIEQHEVDDVTNFAALDQGANLVREDLFNRVHSHPVALLLGEQLRRPVAHEVDLDSLGANRRHEAAKVRARADRLNRWNEFGRLDRPIPGKPGT